MKQEELKGELNKLEELKDKLQSQLETAKISTEYLKEKLEGDNSAVKKEKVIEEIKKEKLRIVPIAVDNPIEMIEEVKKMENKSLTNELKEDMIKDSYAEDLADHLEYSKRILEVRKEVDKLSEEIEAYTKSIDENKNKLNELVTFKFPAKGVYTSMHGWRPNPLGGGQEWHTGVDIAGSGDILSVLDGTVTQATVVDGYGNYVEIDHGIINGVKLKTRYAHLASIYVKQGQKVSKGESVGLMGTTGRSTGVHLHFEVLEDGERVNPKPYLDAAIAY